MAFQTGEGPIENRKIIFLMIILIVLLVAAAVLLPPGLVRIAMIGLLVMPFIFFLFDKPVFQLYFLIFFLFSNLHLFFEIPVIRLIAVFLIISFATACVKGRQVIVHDKIFFLLVGAMALFAFQSMALARDIDSSIYRINFFFRYLIYIFFVIQFSTTRKEFITLLCVMAFAGVLSSFLPLVVSLPEKYADLSFMWEEGVFRYEGFEREANMFAFALNFLIPILLFLFMKFRKPWFIRPVMMALIGGAIYVLYLSFSRGGFIGLAFMFFALLVIERKNKVVVLTGLLLIITAGMLAPSLYWDRITTILDVGSGINKDFSILSRVETMKIALIVGFKNPLFGIGIENFLFYVSRHAAFSDVVHNSMLQIFSDLGWMALAVLSTIIINNFRVIRKMIDSKNDPELSQIGRFLLVQQVAVLVNSLTLPVAFHMIFWFALSLPTIAAYAYRRRLQDSPSLSPAVQK
ncbi:MAG: O-antigen ligase family protein [Candidatus Krumholzibacteriota bacterium]|nr:O-antigen ligase family protein [Candidatus Krumholzibacteriota bacterium]